MTDRAPTWTGRILVRAREPGTAAWIKASLEPEAAREVPRSRARVEAPDPSVVEIAVESRDVGAMRAAVNTYLGWVDLAARTLRAARGAATGGAAAP